MIYLCTQEGSYSETHYYHHNNYIYIMNHNYYETKYDISKRMFVGDIIQVRHRFVPKFTIPDNIIYVDDQYGVFDILEKMIFDKL